MISSCIHKITHPELKPYVQYILFNNAETPNSKATSFSNTNICLGVLHNSELYRSSEGHLRNRKNTGITSYISGMYLEPHEFVSEAPLDEICIDFTPFGFYNFFSFNAKKYILGEDVLSEGFGKDSHHFFQGIFALSCLEQRGELIERYLLQRLFESNNAFLIESINVMSSNYQQPIQSILRIMGCSERKLQRVWKSAFDITPKQYLRINRFRETLDGIRNRSRAQNLSTITYQYGFNDQSHLVKEIRRFTGKSPSVLNSSLVNIDNQVVVSV